MTLKLIMIFYNYWNNMKIYLLLDWYYNIKGWINKDNKRKYAYNNDYL